MSMSEILATFLTRCFMITTSNKKFTTTPLEFIFLLKYMKDVSQLFFLNFLCTKAFAQRNLHLCKNDKEIRFDYREKHFHMFLTPTIHIKLTFNFFSNTNKINQMLAFSAKTVSQFFFTTLAFKCQITLKEGQTLCGLCPKFSKNT